MCTNVLHFVPCDPSFSIETEQVAGVHTREQDKSNLEHMVPKALIGLAVVTVKTDGWVITFRL